MRRCSVVWYIFQLANKYLTISDTSWIGVRNATRTSSVGIGAKPDVGATIGGELKHATSGILRLIGGTSWCVLMRDCTFSGPFNLNIETSVIKYQLGVWRNGSASDSRSEGLEFESFCPHRRSYCEHNCCTLAIMVCVRAARHSNATAF